MDASMMDAEGGRVHLLERRARRLVVIVALQNLLVAACLLLTLYAYCVQESKPEDVVPENIHIRLLPIADIQGNQTLKFINSQSKYKMSLDDKNDDEIIISCTGPYILYMDVCYLSMLEGKEVNGTLWLLDERKTPEILFSMSSSHEVCTALHKTVYFRKTGKASLQLISTTNFKIKTVTVGMSSQLGGQCLY